MIIFLICICIMLVVPVIIHAPLFKVKGLQLNEIKENGLIHFANPKNVDLIMNEGLEGNISHMGGIEKKLGKLVWTYQFRDAIDVDKKHEIVANKKRGREDKDRYKVCLKLSGFSDDDLGKMYKRIGFNGDKAIVYRGERLKPKKIEIIKEW